MLFNIKVFGIVQGVGFRPYIARLANQFNISGTVANKGSYVEIFAQGLEHEIKSFCAAIKINAPPRSAILNIDINRIAELIEFQDFQIIESEHESGDIFVSPDIAICEKCRAELFDKNDRRYLHPFINCTACGPRLTILQKMPYDRERTSMSKFPMCGSCKREHFDPTTRRYDAQPICCNECGPEVYIIDGSERGPEAITKVRGIIKDGGIAAIKGIGGFHLACDATNFEAVQRLRQLKYRPQKPFAVMIKKFSDDPESIVNDFQKPIVLLPKSFFPDVADNVAPCNHKLGIMLPYTPLHWLIFDYPDTIRNFPEVLVMTSGNISGSPIAITDEEAINDLGDICDVILSHNRDILIRADDSVVDVIEGEISMIRRSRGFAPLPVFYECNRRAEVLAIGGELKNTFCLSKNGLHYLSPYIGDMTNLHSTEILRNSINRMMSLLEIRPEVIACDLNPRYHTTKIAKDIAKSLDIPLIEVQHHYAHVLSCMAENNYSEPVIGVAFDGAGYGLDGTVWGGEFLISDLNGFERADNITPFTQAGGDKSSVEGWRIAVAMILQAVGSIADTKRIAAQLNLINDAKLNGQLFLLENGINCMTSTSVGRLFDAVSAVLGFCNSSTFEGEAAMKLQFHAECAAPTENVIGYLSTDKIFSEILTRRLNGENVDQLAYSFHLAMADFVGHTCQRIRSESNISTAALTGGVFQNSLLTTLVTRKLKACGFNILKHKTIPANDGGICLGQAIAALNG